jgi:hypothetical protein
MIGMLALCKISHLGPPICTLTIITNGKRKKAGKLHELYDQAPVALSAQGQPLSLEVR